MSNTYKTLLRYPGGKSRAVKILKDYVHDDVHSVCSPFFGGGSFELYLTSRNIQVEGYDIFLPLVNFWQHVLKQPEDLADILDAHIGKVTKEDFKQMQNILSDNMNTTVDNAARFFMVNRCSFSGATLSGGFSSSAAKGRFTQSSVDKVRNFHNDLLTVEHADALDVINNTDADLLFLDPPYKLDDSFLYGNRGDIHKGFDHEQLSHVVHKFDKPVLLTYNDNDMIRDLYSDYTIVETSWSYGMNSSKKSSEIIIHNM